ncbi:ATP6V0B [Cordylochernes scorpioides]|uniref:ATP6V0B n=1 Tax=Cordylochernes scorpioides TaxID=51811 RepID=A0ABY6K9P9_9ARAC|nr:ATP6V0B [Cordylochernes scorpioides]
MDGREVESEKRKENRPPIPGSRSQIMIPKSRDSARKIPGLLLSTDCHSPFFVTSKDLRKCLNALGHEIPLSAETIKIKVCRYADTFREKVVRELQMEKEKGQLFSLTLDEWTSIRSKRYQNINIHSRTKVWNLGLARISGVFPLNNANMSLRPGKTVVTIYINAKKKERVVPEFVSATVNEAESDLSEDDNEDTSPFNISLEVAHPSFPEAIYPQSPVFSKKNINEATKKSRVVVKLFKRSPLKNEILLNYMRQDNRISTSMCLILDCRTRWDSLLNMLERLLSLKSAIQKALINVKANVRLTDEDFDIMTQVISALKPFRAAVAAICRRDAFDCRSNSKVSSRGAASTISFSQQRSAKIVSKENFRRVMQ